MKTFKYWKCLFIKLFSVNTEFVEWLSGLFNNAFLGWKGQNSVNILLYVDVTSPVTLKNNHNNLAYILPVAVPLLEVCLFVREFFLILLKFMLYTPL